MLALLVLSAPTAAKGPWVEGSELTFELSDLDGNAVSFADPRFEGKGLLVALWGTWCPPCLTEIPTFIDLQRRFRHRGLVVVAIALEGDEDEQARRAMLSQFVAEHGINYLVLDGGLPEQAAEALPTLRDVQGLPVEILIDRNGRVVEARNGRGYKKRWARKLEREIEQLLVTDGSRR